MVLSPEDVKSITDFVRVEPRTIQEIAKHIGKSWVTADSYVSQIIDETRLISVRVFRSGTKAALKVVFWNYSDSLRDDELKSELFERIKNGIDKFDFDPLDIFQHVSPDLSKAFTVPFKLHYDSDVSISLLRRAEKEVLYFSGNLSWVNTSENNVSMIEVIEDLLKKGVSIKILCRIDLASVNNMNLLSSLIKKYGSLLEVKHSFHPLRGFVIDDSIFRLRDFKPVSNYKKGEVSEDTFVYYDIFDKAWVLWMRKVFWNLYRKAYAYESRLKVLETIF